MCLVHSLNAALSMDPVRAQGTAIGVYGLPELYPQQAIPHLIGFESVRCIDHATFAARTVLFFPPSGFRTKVHHTMTAVESTNADAPTITAFLRINA